MPAVISQRRKYIIGTYNIIDNLRNEGGGSMVLERFRIKPCASKNVVAIKKEDLHLRVKM